MKRISFLLVLLALGLTPLSRAGDAATEERLNKLAGRIDDLTAGQEDLRKRVQAMERELDNLREQMTKPTGNYASQEGLKALAEDVKDVDRKRLEDAARIRSELLKLGQSISAPPTTAKRHVAPPAVEHTSAETTTASEKGFGDYVVQKGDNLSLIVQAYREKGIKLTSDQILKANPGLVPEKLRPGQKIWIPTPQ